MSGCSKLVSPHMDTVEDVMNVLDAQHLETLKTELVKGLLAKKHFRKYRLFGQSYLVVIDGTHVMDVHKGHCEHGLHQTFKNGKDSRSTGLPVKKLWSKRGPTSCT